MNCQDITRIVNGENSGALTHEELRDAAEHALSCCTCAPQWLAHRHLDALAIPQLPLELSTLSLALADGSEQAHKSGRARRVTIVVGCVMALAAAAALLVKNVPETPSQRDDASDSATSRDRSSAAG